MGRFSSRQKRSKDIRSRTRMNRFRFINVQKKRRPKTFKTEEAANSYAKKLGLEGRYNLIKVKHHKRFQVVPYK